MLTAPVSKLLLLAALLFTLTVGTATAVAGLEDAGSAAPALAAGKGKIHKAWPHKKGGKKPHRSLARKLARQVGPIKVRKRGKGAASSTGLTAAQARSLKPTTGGEPIVDTTKPTGKQKLLLVRSFDIPEDDPLYADLTNYSWTYDNALATIGFVADKDRAQARQLLDQLAVLQNKNGSWDFAFDVMTGESARVERANATAWVALAGLAYADRYGDRTYDAMVGAAIDLSLIHI